jgi:hypothetical protein
MSYPAPFRRLRDIGLSRSPAASPTLAGTEVSPAVLRQRFEGVLRVWVVTIRGLKRPPPDTCINQAKVALIVELRLAGSWHAGAVVLRLYTRGGSDQSVPHRHVREPALGSGV